MSSTNNNKPTSDDQYPDFAAGRAQEEHDGVTLLGINFAKAALMTVALPFGVTYQILNLMLHPHVPFKKTPPVFPPVGPLLVNKPSAFDDREFDIVVFGATGFAGNLTVKYLAETYGNKVKWALAGRRADALEKIKAQYPGAANATCITADIGDDKSLQAMCARTKVVLTTVGPYQVYGTAVVRAAVATSTSYCDITGEPDWVKGLIDHYDVEARKNNAAIVSFCGHDSIPWDISTMLCADRLKQLSGEDLASIEMVDEVNSSPSGGTLSTVEESIPPTIYRPVNSSFNPIQRTADGNESPYRTKDASSVLVGNDVRGYTGPYPMAMINAQVVRRSNALNGYGKMLTYRESRLGPNLPTVIARYLQLYLLLPAILMPESIKYRLIPAPGSGPSAETMDKGFLQVTAKATGSKGGKVVSRLYFPTCPGYRDTARMLAESGLVIALERGKLKSKGGILTPATCQGSALLDRLVATGTKFAWLSESAAKM